MNDYYLYEATKRHIRDIHAEVKHHRTVRMVLKAKGSRLALRPLIYRAGAGMIHLGAWMQTLAGLPHLESNDQPLQPATAYLSDGRVDSDAICSPC
ncbi:MAG: hypothetical protein SF029_02135 [bacterium]|nr:hypothetical protein [bacterium]